MERTFDSIDQTIADWLGKQHLFFVATAPDGPDGHVNLSPKGAMETFRVLGSSTVAYLDLIGSGIETVAHLRENGRITLMFCAFDGAPNVLRLRGRGWVVEPGEPEYTSLVQEFSPTPEIELAIRSVIVIEIKRIADSCGFSVPRMAFVEERRTLMHWAEHQRQREGNGWARQYQRVNNRFSIDGLPGALTEEELTDEVAARWSSEGRAL